MLCHARAGTCALFRRNAALGIMFIFVAAGLVAVVTSGITTPLHELTNAAEALADGHLAQRVRAERTDEIQPVGRLLQHDGVTCGAGAAGTGSARR